MTLAELIFADPSVKHRIIRRPSRTKLLTSFLAEGAAIDDAHQPHFDIEFEGEIITIHVVVRGLVGDFEGGDFYVVADTFSIMHNTVAHHVRLENRGAFSGARIGIFYARQEKDGYLEAPPKF